MSLKTTLEALRADALKANENLDALKQKVALGEAQLVGLLARTQIAIQEADDVGRALRAAREMPASATKNDGFSAGHPPARLHVVTDTDIVDDHDKSLEELADAAFDRIMGES